MDIHDLIFSPTFHSTNHGSVPNVTFTELTRVQDLRSPCASSRVVRIDPLRFTARRHISQLNQALSDLSLRLVFFLSVSIVPLSMATFCTVLFVCSISGLFLLGCHRYQCKWLTGKTRLGNESNNMLMWTLNPTHSLTEILPSPTLVTDTARKDIRPNLLPSVRI